MAKKPTRRLFIPCGLRQLPRPDWQSAADAAIRENPANRPLVEMAPVTDPGLGSGSPRMVRERLAVLTTRYWGQGGVRLGVAFLEATPADLAARILEHMNAWGATANVVFSPSSVGNAAVRITRTKGGGYWSYLGTDVRRIPAGKPTMNLDSFTMQTPEAEYRRVVRHECGHTLGFPHEHLRRALVNRLDAARTIEYFRRIYDWDEATTRSNVLTPMEESSIMGTPTADETSIMAYQLPGEITRDGRPIVGGTDINEADAEFCARLYPGAASPPPDEEEARLVLPEGLPAGTYRVVSTARGG